MQDCEHSTEQADCYGEKSSNFIVYYTVIEQEDAMLRHAPKANHIFTDGWDNVSNYNTAPFNYDKC